MDHLDAAKIKFTIQQETDLDAQTLKETIVKQLIESGYKIVRTVDLTIRFDDTGDNDWNPREKGFKMMEEGKFDILPSENGTIVRLTYYIDAFFEALLFPFILLGGIFASQFLFFMGSVFLIQFLLKISMIKDVANRIVLDIL